VLHLTGQGSGGDGFAVSVEDGQNARPDESLRAHEDWIKRDVLAVDVKYGGELAVEKA